MERTKGMRQINPALGNYWSASPAICQNCSNSPHLNRSPAVLRTPAPTSGLLPPLHQELSFLYLLRISKIQRRSNHGNLLFRKTVSSYFAVGKAPASFHQQVTSCLLAPAPLAVDLGHRALEALMHARGHWWTMQDHTGRYCYPDKTCYFRLSFLRWGLWTPRV